MCIWTMQAYAGSSMQAIRVCLACMNHRAPLSRAYFRPNCVGWLALGLIPVKVRTAILDEDSAICGAAFFAERTLSHCRLPSLYRA